MSAFISVSCKLCLVSKHLILLTPIAKNNDDDDGDGEMEKIKMVQFFVGLFEYSKWDYFYYFTL